MGGSGFNLSVLRIGADVAISTGGDDEFFSSLGPLIFLVFLVVGRSYLFEVLAIWIMLPPQNPASSWT